MGAMLDMMQRMMGKNPGQGQGKNKGQAGNQAGGESDSPNKEFTDAGKGKKEERTIGKKAGKAGSHLPPEFQKALDAYNKGR